jgi:hypothetical protein
MHEMPLIARRVSAVLAGLLIFPSLSGATTVRPSPVPKVPRPSLFSPALPPPANATSTPPTACLATTLCALKDQVRWRAPAWSPVQCQRLADAVQSAADQYRLSPALILAVMMNESDMNEKAVASYERDGAVYAKDGGLMGIRCVFDSRGRCKNGFVKGMTFKKVMDPATNIALGAQSLAYFRDSGVEKRIERVRGADGQLLEKTRNVRCRHANHAFWAHYNHGMRYIDHGKPRHYPHHVAVLYYELARALALPAAELQSGRITVVDRGLRPRTADRPVEPRYRSLCSKIRSVSGTCRPPATLFSQSAPARPDLALQSRVSSPPSS